MMEYTDRHFRYLCRLLSSRMEIWTEMITAPALVYTADDELVQNRFLMNSPCLENFNDNILQLGGSDAEQLGKAAELINASKHRYTGLNLNCGCPSPRVAGKGCFGAALMLEPKLVAECCNEISKKFDGEVSVKCRIGTDDNDSYENLKGFVNIVRNEGGVREFQVHARVAILSKNFSPADNRNIPPLMYEHVYRLAREEPDLKISLNGGITSLKHALEIFEECREIEGIMVGRSIAAQPWLWGMVDELVYGDRCNDSLGDVGGGGGSGGGGGGGEGKVNTRRELLQKYGEHADFEEEMEGSKRGRRRILRPIGTLFTGEPNGRRFRVEIDKLMATGGSKRGGYSKASEGFGQGPKLSELIMEAAEKTISPAVLDMTKAESLEMSLFKEKGGKGDKEAIGEWNKERKEREKQLGSE